MREVDRATVRSFLDAAAALGVSAAALLEGLPFEAGALREPGPRIDWDDFATLLARIEAALGSRELVEQLGEALLRSPAIPVRRAAQHFASPRTLYWAAQRWLAPRSYRNITVHHEVLGDGRLRQVCRIPDGDRPSRAFLRASVGSLRVLPRLIGLPEALVRAEVGEREAVYVITPPPSLTVFSRVRRGGRVMWSARGAIEELGTQQEELVRSFRELNEAYAALAATERRHRQISELSSDYSYCYSVLPDGGFELEWVEGGFERITGYTLEELNRRTWISIVYEDDRPAVRDWVDRGTPDAFELRIVTSSGALRWIEARARQAQESGGARVYGAALDITERKRAEAALRESDERYRALARSAVDIVVELTDAGSIVYASRSARTLTGFGADDLVGTRALDWIHPDDRARARDALRVRVETGEVPRPVFRIRRRDDGWLWVESSGNLYRTSDGELRLVTILRDVSERIQIESERERYAGTLEHEVERRTRELESVNRQLRELQTRLIQAERLGAVEDLAGSVAHAINNPLTALIGTAEIALESRQDARMERVLQLARRVRDVVARTLELYRAGTIRRSPEDAQRLLEDVRDHLQRRADTQAVDIALKVEPGLPALWVDRPLFTAALVSVAENSLDAMPHGGSLLLEAGLLGDVGVTEFRICDSGRGVPRELRTRVFEPFFTTKGGGTGLGLAIARGVVHGHEGRIRIDDRPGGGAVVTVEIPVSRPDPSPEAVA